jgi:diaminohydroxyphosphoribosylaminopyrimidine deaminase/5-amino-6-(5-phosphoribosylamino)uracil reductase
VRDPNPRVNGGGAARLAAAGIGVTAGLLQAEARALNAGFLSRFERGRPWVRVLLGVPRGGDPGGERVQRLRARASAVLTGVGRVLADDPRLDLQLPQAPRQPLRVVLDTRLRTPASASILAPPGRALVLTASGDPQRRSSAQVRASCASRRDVTDSTSPRCCDASPGSRSTSCRWRRARP